MEKKIVLKHVLLYGVVLGVTLSVTEFMALYLGMLFNTVLSNVFMIIIFVSLFFAVKKYRDQELNGVIEFGNAFVISFFVSITAGIVWSTYRYFQYSLNPAIVEEIVRVNAESFTDTIQDVERRDLTIKLNELFTTPLSLAVVNTFLMAMVFGGSILSLFLAYILRPRKNKPGINIK